ncbi:hypothetical protein, partial [Streptomyces sp. NPDC003857]
MLNTPSEYMRVFPGRPAAPRARPPTGERPGAPPLSGRTAEGAHDGGGRTLGCASGLEAVIQAARAITVGDASL